MIWLAHGEWKQWCVLGQSPAPCSASYGMDLVSMTGEEYVWSTSKEAIEASIVIDKDAICSFIFITTNVSHLKEKPRMFFLRVN